MGLRLLSLSFCASFLLVQSDRIHMTPPPIIPTGSYECFIDDWVMHILMFLFLNWSTNAVFQIAQSSYFTDLSPEGDSYRQLFERQVQLTFISSLKPRSMIGQLFYLLKSTIFFFFHFSSLFHYILICLWCLYFFFFLFSYYYRYYYSIAVTFMSPVSPLACFVCLHSLSLANETSSNISQCLHYFCPVSVTF